MNNTLLGYFIFNVVDIVVLDAAADRARVYATIPFSVVKIATLWTDLMKMLRESEQEFL